MGRKQGGGHSGEDPNKEASADAWSEGVTGVVVGNLRWKRPRLLEIRDVSLFVEVVGDGYPLVLMHGGPSADHYTLLPFRQLADRFTLIFYDHRCNGRSAGAPVSSMSWENLAADAEALRQKLGFERWAVLGHSFVGQVALEYALRYPEKPVTPPPNWHSTGKPPGDEEYARNRCRYVLYQRGPARTWWIWAGRGASCPQLWRNFPGGLLDQPGEARDDCVVPEHDR